MKLLFLGTGSAKCKKIPEDQIPEGKRRCSSTLIDGTVQVDVPIHTYDFLEKHNISPANVTDIFLTHSHDDHFWKETFLRYAKAGDRKLNFYCNTGALPCLGLTEEEMSLANIITVEPLQTFEAAGMTVTALPSNHLAGAGEQTLHYVFEKDGKKLFYGLDGAWLDLVYMITEPIIVPIRTLFEKIPTYKNSPIDFSFMIAYMLVLIARELFAMFTRAVL